MTASPSTYELLIQPIEDRMIRTAWRILRDPDDAKDAMQETLGTVWKRLRRIRRHPNPHALILKMCADAAHDTLRRKIRRRKRECGGADLGNLPDRSANPARRALDSERAEHIRVAIAQLPRHQSVAVTMRLIQEQSYSAISEVLGCNAGTARVHVARGRAKLRVLLADLVREAKEG